MNRIQRAAHRARCEAIAKPRLEKLRAGSLSKEVIDEFRSAILHGDCPLCGCSGFANVAGHVYAMHGVIRREFSDLLGFTYTESICSASLRERMSELGQGKNPRLLGRYSGPRSISKKGRILLGEALRAMPVDREAKSAAGRIGGTKNKGRRAWNRDDTHGRRAMYARGCRCDACKIAAAEYERDRRAKISGPA